MELSQLQEQNLSLLQIQALKVMTMSNSELREYIEEKSEQNPLIVLHYKSGIFESENVSASAEERSENYSQFYLSLPESRKTLAQNLSEQLGLCELSDIEKKIGEMIIQSLDYNGFLNIEPEVLLEKIEHADKMKIYYKMCDVISSFEPAGCACSDLYASLKRQFWLKYSTDSDEKVLAYSLINREDFESYAKANYNLLSKKNKCSRDDIQKAFEMIKSLNPLPGASFNIGYDKFAECDIIITDSEGGGLDVTIDSTAVPEIRVDEAVLKDKNIEKKVISSYRQDVSNLSALVDMRSTTLGRIADFMIKSQAEYIKGEKKSKNPLDLKAVAQNTSLSLSTISRVINCHWAQYKGKMFSLRDLLEQKTFEANTQDDVMEKIKKIIEGSDKKLSDEKIKNALESEYGIKIARRTVQKYRQKLNISSSYGR